MCRLKWLQGLQLKDKNQLKIRRIQLQVFLENIFEFYIWKY